MNSALLVLLTLLGGLLSLSILVLGWILQALAGKEAEAVIQALTADLLRRVEWRLPAGQRARFAEETRAGLLRFSEKRPLWALLQAASLLVAAITGRLVKEFEATEAGNLGASETSEVAKAFAHPLRIQILSLLTKSNADHLQLARQLELDPSTVAYHLRVLSKHGIIEIAARTQRRGAVLHIYRPTTRPLFRDSDWARLMGQPGLEPGTDGL